MKPSGSAYHLLNLPLTDQVINNVRVSNSVEWLFVNELKYFFLLIRNRFVGLQCIQETDCKTWKTLSVWVSVLLQLYSVRLEEDSSEQGSS